MQKVMLLMFMILANHIFFEKQIFAVQGLSPEYESSSTKSSFSSQYSASDLSSPSLLTEVGSLQSSFSDLNSLSLKTEEQPKCKYDLRPYTAHRYCICEVPYEADVQALSDQFNLSLKLEIPNKKLSFHYSDDVLRIPVAVRIEAARKAFSVSTSLTNADTFSNEGCEVCSNSKITRFYQAYRQNRREKPTLCSFCGFLKPRPWFDFFATTNQCPMCWKDLNEFK
ncbi:MAG: hypothetical protein RLZ12_8 [Bacillota bacterium]|jgi:hypothetical protein